MDDVFLTTTEVIEYLQVNLRTVYRLLKAGKLPGVRVGRQWRFRKSDVDAWLESQRSSSPVPGSPVVLPATPEAGTEAVPTARASRRRVLIADDERAVREMLARALALADCDVQTVGDGLKGLEALRSGKYDLLITDLSMPGINGLEVVREARRLYPHLPVVIITGHSSEAAAIEAINLGVAGYLTKPFRIAKVLAVTAHALGDED